VLRTNSSFLDSGWPILLSVVLLTLFVNYPLLNKLTSALNMEAICSFETVVSTYKFTRRYYPEQQPRYGLRAFENRMLRRIFGPKGKEVSRGWRKLHNLSFVISTLH
jgi:hypothetical protein